MKLYEYGAAGLPVLTKRTEELERRREDYISLYDNYDEMTNKLNEVLKNNKEIDTKRFN